MSKSAAFVILLSVLYCDQSIAQHILPQTGFGSCTAGTPFTINSIADLKSNIKDLECIFAAGVAPDAIGLGFNYGTVLLGDNSG